MKSRAVRWFLAGCVLLAVFAALGQLGADRICRASEEAGRWGTETGFPRVLGTIALTGAAVLAVAGFFRVLRSRESEEMRWIFCLMLAGGLLFFTWECADRTKEHRGTYIMAGWEVVQYDRLEDQRNVWEKTRFAGRGEEIYPCGYDAYEQALRYLREARLESEEYTYSMIEDRAREHVTFDQCDAGTLLLLLSYFHGKWVLALYTLLCLQVLGAGLVMLPSAGDWSGKTLYLSAWVLLAALLLLPALNACGLVFADWGPPFTGKDSSFRVFHAVRIGLSVGAMLGLTQKPAPAEACGGEE